MSLSEQEILNVIQDERNESIGVWDTKSELGKQRAQGIDYYHGKMDDLPALKGWSSVTTRDVYQTIESVLPDILEVFTSSEDIMEFMPETEEDVGRARQETDAVNHVFYQQNQGFLVLYTFIKDALQAKNGFVKVWWEKKDSEETEIYNDQTDLQLSILQGDTDVEIVEIESYTPKLEGPDDLPPVVLENGKLEEAQLHNVVVKRSKDASRARVMAVPPEEVAISNEAKCLQEAALVRHQPRDITRSSLLEMGLDADKVNNLKAVDRIETRTEEAIARNTLEKDDTQDTNINNSGQDRVEVADNYVRIDINENGKSELWHIMTGDDDSVVLFKDRIARVPISTMTPIIEPHQLFGLSLADLVMDLQRLKTFLTRSAVDNAASLNNQRPIISEQGMAESTIDDILMNRVGSPIAVRGDVRAAMTYAQNNNIAPDMLSLVKYFDGVQTERTGITRFGQDMDPDALKRDISATEFSGQRMDALKAVRLIALIFAETGLKDMMINIHHTLQANSGDKKLALKLNNKFVMLNPREWRTRTDMQINIGLGTGTKAEQIEMLRFVLGEQKQAFELQGFQDGRMVTLKKIRYTEGRIVELMGFKTSDSFFNQVEDEPPQKQQPKPDPAMAKVMSDAANNKEKNAIDHQKNVMNAQIEQEDNNLDRQVQIFQIVQELQMKAKTLDQEFDFKQSVAMAELMLKNKALDLKAEETGLNMGVDFAERLDGISTNLTDSVRVGGDAG